MHKILFLTTAHHYNDDRIFYHQANELVRKGFDVKICSLSSDFIGNIEGVEVESYQILQQSASQKLSMFQKVIQDYHPDCIICSEPLAVISTKNYKKQNKISVIYDVTEWYPSISMLRNYSVFSKIFHAIKFFLINCYAGFLSSKFIFGETSKKFPLAHLFLFKKQLVLPYYPSKEYIFYQKKAFNHHKIKLCVAGVFSKEKGIENFIKGAWEFKKQNPNIKTSLLFIGTVPEKEMSFFNQLLLKYSFDDIEILKPTSFKEFTHSFRDADICFDLRALNWENHRSLPIKLFYYVGAGKPVFYSKLKAISKNLDISSFGFLVNPKDFKTIATYIKKYIETPDLYDNHAQNARAEFLKKYNWEYISDSFVNFIKK